MDAHSPDHEPRKPVRIGPMAAIVIVILIMLVGAVYFFLEEHARFHTPPVQETINA